MIKDRTRILISYNQGTSIKGFVKNDLKNLKIPLPSLKEQEKIANILTTWDNAISNVELLIFNYELRKKGLMQKLLSGEVRFSGFCDEWKIKKIEDLPIYISDGNYGELYPKSRDFKKSGIPFLRANNFKNLDIGDNDMKYISIEQHQILKSGHLKTDDILITTRGDLGNIALVKKQFNDANINAQICLLRITNKDILNYKFLLFYLDSYSCKKQYKMSETGTALKQLPKGNLKKIKIKLPLLKEQQKIAQVLSNVDKEIDLLKNELEELKKQKKD